MRIKNQDQAKSPGGSLYKIVDSDALYAAAIARDADAIAALEMHAGKRNRREETILHTESRKGKTEHVRFILREFPDKNLLVKLSTVKWTALHLASSEGHTEVVAILIDAATHLLPPSPHDDNTDDDNPVTSFQAFLRQADKWLETALYRAVEKGHAPIVKLLVEADPRDKHIQNERGRTPMYVAVERGYNDIVEIISTTCTAPSLNGPDGSAVMRIKNQDQAKSPGGSLYKIVDNDALYAAAIARDADAIAALEMQADKRNKYEETILHTESRKGKTEHVRFILREFPDKNLLVKLQNRKGTALHVALYAGHTEVAEILVNAATHLLPTTFQAFLRQADDKMDTALHAAVQMKNVALVELLVEADPSDSHTQNSQGETPIYIAVERGYYDTAKMICTTCTAPTNLEVPSGSTTVLHILIKKAAQEEDTDAIENIDAIAEIILKPLKVVNNYLPGKSKMIRTDEEIILEPLTVEDNYLPEKSKMIELWDRTDEERCTILQLAVERNHLKIVNLILQAVESIVSAACSCSLMDVEPVIRTFMSIKSLSYKAMDKEHIDMFNSLTTAYEACKEQVPRIGNKVDRYKMWLISAICHRQEESVISILKEEFYLEHPVTFADNLGWTALHHAAYHEFDTVIHAIVEAQKRFRHSFVYQDMLSTPFQVAAAKGYTSTVICLMQSWPSSSSAYTVVDKNERSILHLAALQSKKEMIQGILKYCSQELKEEFVNKQDKNGDTPLHILIRRGCFIPELLKYEGLHLRVKNKRGWTAADMLYSEEKVIDDQVQIKLVIDGLHPSKDIFSNSVLPSIRMKEDKILHEQAKLKVQGKYAAMKGDTDAIATCFADAIAGDSISAAALKMKADKPNELKETILHVESKKGDIENVRLIVSEFANKSLLGKLDRSKQTALHLAAQHGHIQVVKALIDAARLLPSSSANDDSHNTVGSFQGFIRQANDPDLNTALHLAVLNGKVEIVKLLVEADPNASHVQNKEGKTPIYIAAENGYKDIIKEICTACRALSLDGPGGRTTALHALIENMDRGGEIDVIGMMVNRAKCWSTAQNASDADFRSLFSKKDKSERTVLQLAVERDDVNAVTLTLQEDPAYQRGGEKKRNDLMRLICKAIDNEYSPDIIKSLSETYKDGIIDHDPNHVLALILAIHKLDKESVLNLLEKAKTLVTFTEDNGWTPLHYAVYYEFDWILDAIIKAQNDLEHPFVLQEMEKTPFYLAVKHGYTSTLLRLMKLWPASSSTEGSLYTIRTQEDQNILHLAAAADSADKRKAAADNRKEMVQGILKYCPKMYKDDMLKQPDSNGDTPLHLIISQGCFIPELVKYEGLDTKTRNKQGFTPMDMLYVKDAIVEDQVNIKIALDEVQNDQSVWKRWFKRAEKETDIWKCNKTTPGKRKNKDVKFEVEKKDLEQKMHKQRREDLERYKTRTNTQILVTALITTVTFTVGFTMPGGLHQSGEVGEGLVVLSRRRAFNIFMMSDALTLLMSTSSLFLYFLESMNDDLHQVSLLNTSSTVLNILSIMGMMLTFISGTYVVLSDSPALAIAVCITGSLFFFLIPFLWIIKRAYNQFS
ncbi:uncharacterized protein LOC108201513 [Daucus carota subsp. sativus]|uniref:uncharacterized protein LOC108201513 n=1 Tax=Daucus carota subsp. sativus TaxID=79200 RepID=UPI0030833FDE